MLERIQEFLEEKPVWVKIVALIIGVIATLACIQVFGCILIKGAIMGIQCDFILLCKLDTFLNVSYTLFEIIIYNICLAITLIGIIAIYVYVKLFKY